VGEDGIRRTAPLDRDGNYEIENLLPGPTEIFVEPEGWFGHLRKRVGLQPLERYLHDVALPATGGLEVSIDGVPKAGAKTVGCAIEDQAGVWRGLHRVGTGWGHMDMAPGEYRVKGTGMAPHMTTISVEPGQVARARLRWSAGIDMELTVAGGTGAVRSCMCWLSGESHASVFGGGERTLGFGNPRVWRYRVATGQVYKLQLWSEHDGRQSAVLVTPSGWPAEEVWRPTVLFR
jgi:hypothetical protein